MSKRLSHPIVAAVWAAALSAVLLSAGCERKKERTVPELAMPLTVEVPIFEIGDVQLRKGGNP